MGGIFYEETINKENVAFRHRTIWLGNALGFNRQLVSLFLPAGCSSTGQRPDTFYSTRTRDIWGIHNHWWNYSLR